MSRILDDWLDSYLEFTHNSEPAETFRLWSGIATIAGVLQRKCVFEFFDLTFYPNMYTVLVGPPAARKGTAMDQARPFLEELDIKMAAEAITREALIRELKESNDNLIIDGEFKAFHSSLTIWAQELTVFLGYNNLQLMSDLTDWYDCKSRWTYRTKHEGVDDITGVYVNLFGATTPDLIRSAMPLDAIGGGLTSRIIFVYEPDKGKIVPLTIKTPAQIQIGIDLKKDLRRMLIMSGGFKYEGKKFTDLWVDWYLAQEGNNPFEDNKFTGYFARRAPHVLKLSMIASASRSDEMIIRRTDLERSIRILERTEEKMPRTFAGVGKAPHADVLAKVMYDIGMEKHVKLSDLQEVYRNDADAFMLSKIVETMESMKFIVRETISGDTILHHKKTYDKENKDENSRL